MPLPLYDRPSIYTDRSNICVSKRVVCGYGSYKYEGRKIRF